MDQAFLDFLSGRENLLLSGHEHPDGDCLGSQVALFHLLRALGKQPLIHNPDPVPGYLDFLSQRTAFGADEAGASLPTCDGVVLLDCAELSRLAGLGAKIAASGLETAVIDHHVGAADGDGSVSFVDTAAAATGVLVYRLFQQFEVPLVGPAAEGVFLSLIADTGWFRYSNTGSEVLRIASEMVDAGVDPSRMYDAIHRRKHLESVDMFSRSLDTHRFSLAGKYGYACLDKSAMARASRISFNTDSVLEPIRSVEGVEVVALLKELFDGGVKVSLRAMGEVDVRAIAASFGGGGHTKAAGAVLRYPMHEAVAVLEDRVKAALEVRATPGGDA